MQCRHGGPARRLARRHQHLTAEIRAADAELRPLITTAAPQMLTQLGVGLEVTGQLLTTIGDDPDRMRSEAASARPLRRRTDPRLDRQDASAPAQPQRGPGGEQRALHRGVDPAAAGSAHPRLLHRRRAEGLSKREVTRCLQRYVARELYQLLVALPASSSSWPSRRAERVGQP